MGFGQGLSGLNAAAQNLDVIGNNIANSGTVGFKAGSASFADVYASSRVGLGVQVSSINQRFTTGTVSATGNQFDMAIDGAKGLFVVQQPDGSKLYTRNGQFYADKDNRIVNAQGQQLTGFAASSSDPLSAKPTTLAIPLNVPVGDINPKFTQNIVNKVNLDAGAVAVPAFTPATPGWITLTDPISGTPSAYTYTLDAAGRYVWSGATPAAGANYTTGGAADPITFDATGQPTPASIPVGGGNVGYVAAAGVAFNPADATTFSNMTPVEVFDSLGTQHTVNQYYVKRPVAGGANHWDVYYTVDGNLANGGNPAALKFNASGVLDPSTSSTTLGYTIPASASAIPAPLSIAVSYSGSTQFDGDYTQNFTQDGYQKGEYASLSIGADGAVIANYTNGATQVMGYVALADFNNLQGLQPVGGNAWAATANSGQAIVGTPGTNGLAALKGQAVEESNVDMSQELVNMIIAQRTYQANAETIKTQDQVLQTLISMR